uniref:Integrase catalytic domain-containing protein n=1 Tax=Fagus sylvatica TaxID=28930 RepID=A0A2N9FFF5_FAGSY
MDMNSYWWPLTISPNGWKHALSRMSLRLQVTRFVKHNIICRYGMPEMLITDNASNLNNCMMDQLCQQFKIQHCNSTPYHPKMNRAVEAANKNVKKILSKMTHTYKDWHE